MKKIKHSKLISSLLSVIMLITSAGIIPVNASAADTDAVVTHFRQMRCNNGKTNTSSYTNDTYYGSGYLINILDGTYLSDYATQTTSTRTDAEIKTSAHEYGLMRIKLNSENTELVGVQFSVNGTNKKFAAYEYANEYADWTEQDLTDNNHVPTSVAAVDITYAASLAAGYDWSQKNISFDSATPISEDISDSDKLIDFTIPISDEDNAAGYKDILIKNNTDDDDATKIMVGEPTVTTYIKSIPAAVEITGQNTINITNKNRVQTAEYVAEITDNSGAVCTDEVTWSVVSGEAEIEKKDNRAILTTKSSVNDGDIIKIKAAVNEDVYDEKEITVSQTFAKKTVISGESSATVYASLLPAVIGKYTSAVTDASDNPMNVDVVYSVSDTDIFEISSDGTLTIKANVAAGEYRVDITSSIDASECENGIAVTSEPFSVIVKVSDENPEISLDASQLLWFRANGRSDGVADGSCGSNWYYSGDSGLKESNEIESGTGFGLITSYDIGGIDSGENDLYNFKIKLTSAGASEKLAIWAYDAENTPYYGSGIDKKAVTTAIKTMLPSWNTDWTYGNAAEDASPLSVASVSDGVYTFEFTYEQLKECADESGMASFFITSENLSSRVSATKVYLSGNNAPKLTYSYRAKPQIDGITIKGADKLVFSGTAPDGDNKYEAKFKTQFEDVTYDITDGMTTWSIDGNENVSYNASEGTIRVSDALPEGIYTVTLKVRYKKGDTIYNAEKDVEIEKKEASVLKSVRISGNSSINLITSELPSDFSYTAEVLNQSGEVMKNEECDWSISGTNIDGISIDDKGVLTVGEGVVSTLVTIRATSKTEPTVYSEMTVAVHVSEYASTLYPTDDVLFRKGNTDTKNVNGAEIEITNSVDNDRAFVGGLKFDISSLRQAIKENQPIVSIKLRLTSSLSKDGKLMLKPLSNDWNESDSTENSYEAKNEIITKSVSSVADVIDNEENKSFTLNRKTKDKYIYEIERAENESIDNWQTEIDITDYLLGTGTDSDLNKNGYIADNQDEDFVSFLIMANYNGTSANKVFTKDVSETTYADHWQQLVGKFPEISENIDILKPAIIIDYAQESVSITSDVSTLPIPLTDKANSTYITAEHYNPFTGKTDTDISWSIVGYSDETGEYSGTPQGVSVTSDGMLSVSKSANKGTVTVRAASKSNSIIYTDFTVSIVKLADQLTNGSFENVTDAMMPTGWTSYDADIDGAYNGVRRYKMDQTSETQFSNITRASDDDGLLSGAYTTDSEGNKALMFKGAAGIDKDYEGYAYAHNAANSSADGGPDIRVTSGITYWISQDYRMQNLYQLNDSAVVGPYISYEGFQGTTSKKSQFGGTWYFKDGNPTSPYTTDGYDTLVKQITVPANVNRLRINWGFKACEGEIYYRNFRIAPQGIDTSKTAADGVNELKVTDKMTWTSDPIVVVPGSEYTYKLSVMTDNVSTGLAVIVFKNSEGEVISEKEIKQSKTLQWSVTDGTVVPPEDTAYAEIRLENGAKSGSVWYDDIIFTQSTSSVPTYMTLKSDNTLVTSPVSGENRYTFTALVTDQYNNPCEAKVNWSVDYAGLSILDNGTLIVSSEAAAGNAVIKAETDGKNGKISDTFTVKIIKQTVDAESVTLINGDFSEKDENNLPAYWTNTDRELSIANSTFDTAVSGWKLNYTTYTSSDTSALIEWDSSVDHTGNSGGSAKIYNADRAQGSMQISDNITVTGGQLYDLSVWVKTNNVSTDSNIYVNVLLYDKNGSTIEENKQLLSFYPEDTDGKGNNTSDWTKLSGSMFINENAVKMRIDMRYRGGANNMNGTAWFDDLSITKQSGIDMEKSFNGKPALMLKGYNFENNDFSRTYGEKWDSTPVAKISEGQEYYYSVSAQTFDVSDGAYVMITYYNDVGRIIGTEISDKISNAQNWEEIKGVSTAPAGAVSAVMSLCIDGNGTVWFADAKFETKAITEVTAISIEGNDTVMASSENYYYAVITDQYGLQSDIMNIAVTVDTVPSGMQYDQKSGKLTVSDNIAGGTGITLRTVYNGLTATKNVKTLAESTSISISGSDQVAIPSSTSKAVTYRVYNQLSQQIDSSAVKWSVTSTDVSIENGILTIPTGISSKSITITAEYNGLKASITVLLSASASQGSGGGGGGGGGSSWTSNKVQISVTPTLTPMGNFDTDGNISSGLTQDSGTTVESLLPQPDPTYFTQGMDNIAGFTDIGHVKWAHKAIAALRNVNIISGKEETKFCPDDSITRAEFAHILIGMLNYAERIDTSDARCKFEDVPDNAWYYNSVAAAVKYGIVSGISDREFAPDVLISRQDMCVMIDRACSAANIILPRGASLIFNDEESVSDYASNSVMDMSRAGIISGFDDGTFRPLENATRAQAAVIIYRMAGGAE